MNVSRRMDFRVSGGLLMTMIYSHFGWNETVTITQPVEVTLADLGQERETKIMFGAWADAGATWKVNDRASFFGAFQYQMADEFEQTTDYGTKINFDSSSLMFARTGFNWAF
jgi:hypothetical protein